MVFATVKAPRIGRLVWPLALLPDEGRQAQFRVEPLGGQLHGDFSPFGRDDHAEVAIDDAAEFHPVRDLESRFIIQANHLARPPVPVQIGQLVRGWGKSLGVHSGITAGRTFQAPIAAGSVVGADDATVGAHGNEKAHLGHPRSDWRPEW